SSRSELVSPVGVASVECVVFEDRNGDGVQQDGEPGVPGVLAHLSQDGSNDTYNERTGADGHVVLWGKIDTPSQVTVDGYGSQNVTFTYGRAIFYFGNVPA